jgi:hypothetical protein
MITREHNINTHGFVGNSENIIPKKIPTPRVKVFLRGMIFYCYPQTHVLFNLLPRTNTVMI